MKRCKARIVRRVFAIIIIIFSCVHEGIADPPSILTQPALQTPATSEWVYITRFSTDTTKDSMIVYHRPLGASSESAVAPWFCVKLASTNAYATDSTEENHKLHHEALIGAFLHHKQVQILVAGCPDAQGNSPISSVSVRD
jgi:hypothetical protein